MIIKSFISFKKNLYLWSDEEQRTYFRPALLGFIQQTNLKFCFVFTLVFQTRRKNSISFILCAPRRGSLLLLRSPSYRVLMKKDTYLLSKHLCVVTDNCGINDINLSIFHTIEYSTTLSTNYKEVEVEECHTSLHQNDIMTILLCWAYISDQCQMPSLHFCINWIWLFNVTWICHGNGCHCEVQMNDAHHSHCINKWLFPTKYSLYYCLLEHIRTTLNVTS